MRYGRYRFLLYKKWDYARNMRTAAQQEALDAGKALFKAANIEHWASQRELVLALTSQIAGIRTSAGFRLFLGAIM